MFFYLHFTRPPPEQCHISQPFLIAPSIANDLRTELFPETIDIYHAWVKCLTPSDAGRVDASNAERTRMLGPMTQPHKLTAWGRNAYKEVQVFPPREARPGESWQLMLCTPNMSSAPARFVASIDLSGAPGLSGGHFGANVLPILSSPILFGAHPPASSQKDRKQVRNERTLKLQTITTLRMVEHLSFDLDKKVWDSGLGLSHWLASTISSVQRPSVVNALMNSESPVILELGTGTGLVSIVLAALLSQNPRASIHATDLESAMEILESNIVLNNHIYPDVQLQASVLDWDADTIPEALRHGIDMIIMADVTYNTASFPSLIRTLSRLSKLRIVPPSVLLAYKERDPDERRLFEMAASIGLTFERIEYVPGHGGAPVEIYAGIFTKKTAGMKCRSCLRSPKYWTPIPDDDGIVTQIQREGRGR